jgi:hypothetical protein
MNVDAMSLRCSSAYMSPPVLFNLRRIPNPAIQSHASSQCFVDLQIQNIQPAELLVPVVPRSVPPMLLSFPPPLSCKLIFDIAADRHGSCTEFSQFIRSALLDARGGFGSVPNASYQPSEPPSPSG